MGLKEIGTDNHRLVLTPSSKEKHDVDCAYPLEDKLKQLTRPYHSHLLELVYHEPIVECQLCNQNCNSPFYTCANGCDFAVDVECSSIKSIIISDFHYHPLIFCEKLSKKIFCNVCISQSDGLVFRCLQCSFELDFKCGPIPSNIKSRHMHALDLCDTFVEDDIGEDSCDICEKRRDPREAVYLCYLCKDRGCAYVAEIQCVIPEVIKALKGDLGVVELRTVGTHVRGKVITEVEEAINDAAYGVHVVGQLTTSLMEEEKNKLQALSKDVMPLRERKYKKLSDVISYSDEAFNLFIESLDHCPDGYEITEPFELLDDIDGLRPVEVAGDYKIPQPFLFVYEDLVSNYDDVSKYCKFGPTGKSLLFGLLLSEIYAMRCWQVSHVTMDSLQECHVNLKFVHLAGFRIQFAIDNMNKLARAYFGLQLIKFGQDRLKDLNRQIERHLEEIKEQEVRLQRVQTEQGQHTRHMRAKKSRLMGKCWSEGRVLKYKVGWEFMLCDSC